MSPLKDVLDVALCSANQIICYPNQETCSNDKFGRQAYAELTLKFESSSSFYIDNGP